MNVGLIDVDGHNFPNLPLMKLSAWHKARGDAVEWYWGFGQYDVVYMSKVFDETYTPDVLTPTNTARIVKGGTGYVRRNETGALQIFYGGHWTSFQDGPGAVVQYQEFLPPEIEHAYPDYSLYREFTKDTAYGFLTRGCPRSCGFCLVSGKEGRTARKVADLSEWWDGQDIIKLLDPNLLACPQREELLRQLAESGARVDFTQGLDARLLTRDVIALLNQTRKEKVHFAWDSMEGAREILRGLELYTREGDKDRNGSFGTVYVLTNYGTTMAENLERIYTLRDLGFDPYVMIYDKPHAPAEIRDLQRWCNGKRIFGSTPDFHNYKPRRKNRCP